VVVGGVTDHVHILFGQGKMRTPVAFVEHVKKSGMYGIRAKGHSVKQPFRLRFSSVTKTWGGAELCPRLR